jgi:hypothetical protein
MWVVWLVVGVAGAAFLAVLVAFRADYRSATLGWQLLVMSGVLLAVGGVDFAVRFWEPTRGPYRANQLYPLGPYLNAWAVSFGFTWIAFGLLFVVLALLGARQPLARLWVALLASWVVCWLPHGVIGVGFAWAGHNEPSLRLYLDWASGWVGMIRLCASSLLLLGHFACSIGGFVVTGLQLCRAGDVPPAVEQSDSTG